MTYIKPVETTKISKVNNQGKYLFPKKHTLFQFKEIVLCWNPSQLEHYYVYTPLYTKNKTKLCNEMLEMSKMIFISILKYTILESILY